MLIIVTIVRHPSCPTWPPSPAGSQRHINGVVSKNKIYDNFGFGGIKGPFWYDPV